ncbi:hypothetical protein BRADI_2g59212v3 [Brachypodium distachyon]|uniref:Uncharacterized protein n=1 Tax=Brachypodium distachyon TaxID=15368 RepID=A0A2K2DGU9_BRADI|nr:hypothetical protein BRADI_2g59212v3 [Brachypodium distachyon]
MESSSMILICSLFSISHPITQELAALVSDGAKASIIESPPCFSTSFVQIESWRGAESVPITGSFSLSMLPYASRMWNLGKSALYSTRSVKSCVAIYLLHRKYYHAVNSL